MYYTSKINLSMAHRQQKNSVPQLCSQNPLVFPIKSDQLINKTLFG